MTGIVLAMLGMRPVVADDDPLPRPIFEAPVVYVRPIDEVALAERARDPVATNELGISGHPMERVRARASHLREALSAVDVVAEHRMLAAEMLDPAVFGAFGEARIEPIESFDALGPRRGKDDMIDLQARVLVDADLSAFRVGLGLYASPPRTCLLCLKDQRYYWYVVPHPSLPDWRTWEQNGPLWEALPPEEIQRMLREALRGAWQLMLDDLRAPRRESLGKRLYAEPSGARIRRLHVVHRVDAREWLHGDPFGRDQWSLYSVPLGWKLRPTRR